MAFQEFLGRHDFTVEQRATLSTLLENPTVACIFSDSPLGDELWLGGPSNDVDTLAARKAVTWLTIEQKAEFHKILVDLVITSRVSKKE